MSNIIIQPLNDHEFLTLLRDFRKLLSSSMGLCGGLKLVVSAGGAITLTSSSERLIRSLVISHPICVFIVQIIKSQLTQHGDYGLYTGVLISSLLENLLTSNLHLNILQLQTFLSSLISNITSIMNSNQMKIPVDFSSVEQLLCIADTVLASKPAHGLTKQERKSIEVNVIKSFLISISEDDVSEVIVVSGDESLVYSQVFDGILYEIADDVTVNLLDHKLESPSLVLFNIMLTFSGNDCNSEVQRSEKVFLEKAMNVLKTVVMKGVHIVACQKVIHPTLRFYLEKKKILVLERLGTNLTSVLEKLSGAVPVSSIERYTEKLENTFGKIDCAKKVTISGKSYVLLEKKNVGIATLFLNARGEESTAELKVVVGQCLKVLRQLSVHSYVTPGAGCLESCLIVNMQKLMDRGEMKNLNRELLSILKKCLIISSGLKVLSIDNIYYHAWTKKDKCRCGLVHLEDVVSLEGEWITLNTTSTDVPFFCNSEMSVSSRKLCLGINIDLHIAKHNAITLAIENCCNILRIGTVIRRHSES